MPKSYSYNEVSKHNSAKSCWVILYGDVYDVTDFLAQHPGGAGVILQLAGQDATEAYDPVHPPGILQEQLKTEARLGVVDASSGPAASQHASQDGRASSSPPPKDGVVSQTTMIQNKHFPSTVGTLADSDLPVDLQTLLNLDDIEAAATLRLRPKAWAYYYSAGDDLISKSLNNSVYSFILLRPRIFVDCTRCNTSTTILGHKVNIPIFISPAAMARLAHPSGEHGIAQAAGRFGAMQLISNNASQTPEQIVAGAAPGQVFGWQLYVQTDRRKSEEMLRRVRKLPQIKFVCLTLDAAVPGKREHDERAKNVGASLPVSSATRAATGLSASHSPEGPETGIKQASRSSLPRCPRT